MPTPIRRHYLPDEVESRLLDALRRGEYGDRLPGERTLAENFGVSRPTLRRAIAALAAQGWLKPTHGRATRILLSPEQRTNEPVKTRRVVFLSSHPMSGLSAGTMLACDLLSESLAGAGYTMRFSACTAFRLRQFDRAMRAMLKKLPADAYVLHQAPEAVQRWFLEQRVPALVMGTPAAGVALPGIDTDFRPAAEHAMHLLAREGHSPSRVLLLTPKLNLAGNRAMRDGFLAAGGLPVNAWTHPVDDEAFALWLAHDLMPAVRAEGGPTAVIAGWARFTVGMVTGVATRHGVRIPESLSVVCLADDPVFDMMIPRVTRYRRSADKFVKRLTRLALEVAQNLPPSAPVTLLMPELVPGGTVGAPRGA